MPRWLIYTLLTMLLWGGWGAVSKPLATSLSAWQVQCFSTVGLLPVVAILATSRRLGAGSRLRRGFAQAFAAGVIGSAGNIACYKALAVGGKAAAVMPLTSLYPLVTIVLALLMLGERLSRAQVVGIVISLAAMACFNFGADAALLTPWLAVALIPIGLWGISALLQKLATFHCSSELATLAFLTGFLPVAVLTPLVQPMVWSLSGQAWLLLILLGFFFGLGNLTLIFAYGAGGGASIVTPLASLYSLVTIPLAVLIFHEKILPREGLGIALALVAIVALSRERSAAQNEETAAAGVSPAQDSVGATGR